jgi:hypothetical protein
LILGSLVAFAACKGTPQVSFDIALPSDLADTTAWFEIGAFRDASCDALAPMLANGIPSGAAVRVAFRRDDATTPTVGDLPRASYAFAAVAKNEDCAILATGCTEVDVSSSDSVLVALNGVDMPTGACGAGASCQAAECVPANDNSDPSVGASCSLELLGAGPLANPAGGNGEYVSAPAIAATPSGFIIVYREVDPSAATAKIDILPIDPAGGALPPARPALGGRCANDDETDGLGLVMNATQGEMVVAKPACGAASGLELLGFTTKPEVTPEDKSHLAQSNAQKIRLSDAHVAAARMGGDVIAFVADGQALVSTITPAGVAAPAGGFGATASNTGAWVAASDKVLALLAAGPGDPGMAPPPDAGDDGGGEGGMMMMGDDGGGSGEGATLRLYMLPVDTPLDMIAAPSTPRSPIAFPGTWGAVAAVGKRVIVLSDGSGPGRSVTYRTFDLDGTMAAETNGFSVQGDGDVTTGDVALLGDRVFFAALKPGLITLNAYSNATTSPVPIRSISFAKETRIPAINLVRDGRVSLAVTDTRVAVVWTTAKTLGANDPAGGYAVFACTQ